MSEQKAEETKNKICSNLRECGLLQIDQNKKRGPRKVTAAPEAKSTKQHRKNSQSRQQKLAYSVPLLSIVCGSILIWHHFGPSAIITSIHSISSDISQFPYSHHRHLAESNGDFPDDTLTYKQKQSGYITIHCLIMLYMFLGLAKICDDYFEPTLSVLCERLNIKDDVAGATWMAAGGSAPELFTSIIGVFIAKSDIGFGTIVGSAVFNVLAVIAACAFCVPDLPVTGWPLARDSVYYCFGILVIVSCVEDQRIYWYEALVLLGIYAVYVYIMRNNARLEALVTRSLSSSESTINDRNSYSRIQRKMQKFMEHSFTQTFIFVAIIINVTFVIYLLFADSSFAESINFSISIFFVVEMALKLYCYGPLSYWVDVWNALDGVLVILIIVEYILANSTGSGAVRALRLLRLGRVVRSFRIFKLMDQLQKLHISTGTQTKPTSKPLAIQYGDHLGSHLGDNLKDPVTDCDTDTDTDCELNINCNVDEGAADREDGAKAEIKKIHIVSISGGKGGGKHVAAMDEIEEFQIEDLADCRSPSRVKEARKAFNYNNTVRVDISKKGKKRCYFEHKTNADDFMAKRQRRRVRLITTPDGKSTFEEYYSVRGSRISRSYTGNLGNFNLAIIPVAPKEEGSKGLNGPLADVHDGDESDESSDVWKGSADFSDRVGDNDDDDEGPLELWDYPSDGNILEKATFLVLFPLTLIMFYTIIDTQKPSNAKWWPLSFTMCIVWIGALSYVMVWMASEIGTTASIPEPIMGITILAAGTSIPDMLSSLAVAKKGRGDMAVSSSIGSNIFDILFGLPFPWFVKTAIWSPGSYVFIKSDGMTIMVLSLFLMVAFVILSIQQFQWKLSRKLAYLFGVLYVIFVIEAMLIEYGVIFGG